MKALIWPVKQGIPALVFLTEWLRSPLGVGAVAPSSRCLAKAITQGLSGKDGPVLELGPGTGVFTTAILDRGVRPNHVAALEIGDTFADQLASKFPDIIVVRADATLIKQNMPFKLGSVQTVICGLPLLSMPRGKVQQILAGSFDCLKPCGEFRLFTYGHQCPVPTQILELLNLSAKRSAFVVRNLPPASVYIIKRQAG